MDSIRSLEQVLKTGAWHNDGAPTARVWVTAMDANPWPLGQSPMLG
jgi:6-hydroxynicotinate reductase